MISVDSYSDFNDKIKGFENFWLFIYKKTSEQSDCAYNSILESEKSLKEESKIYTADVNLVKDVHTEFDVQTVPTLLKFENKEFKGV